MLLQKLREYAASGRMRVLPTLYSETPVRYVIQLDASGHLLAPEPIDTADPADKAMQKGKRRQAPVVQRSSGTKPLLLADGADYTLGLVGSDGKATRAAERNRAYLDLVDRCADASGEPAVRAVSTFLHSEPLAQLSLPQDFDDGAKITFLVDGVCPIDLPEVQAFWARANAPAGEGDEAMETMQCLVCGQVRPALARMQLKVKGVPGGQTSGTAIISANADAFESYGLTASLIAPVCAACGEQFTNAANALIAGEGSHVRMGGAVFIFWTQEDSNFDLLELIDQPEAEDVKALLASVCRGGPPLDVDAGAFYAATLSGSGGRTVVRDWIDTTVGEAKRHLAGWFSRQRIVDPNGAEPRPLGLYPLAACTVRDASRELAPPTPRALLHAALSGGRLPEDLLYQAVRRNRAEQGVTLPRAALIKLVMCSRDNTVAGSDNPTEEDRMACLDPTDNSPAYRCGRLLAVLERVQHQALPGINATIVDRFYGTASSAPASVFPRLLRGAQPHLAKLQRDHGGTYWALQGRLEEVMSGLERFPSTLTLEEQGLFALGYYHQRAHDRAAAMEAKQRREQGANDSNQQGE